MLGLVSMSKKEIHRVEVIQKLIDKRLVESDAAIQFNISIRQVRRLKQAYKKNGAFALTSKKRGARSNHKYPESLKEVALMIVRENYTDFRPTFACEKLRENHQITVSNETLRKWMIEADLWIPRSQRLKRAYQPRNRRECYGELIQIDGSLHDWFEERGDRCTLLVYIDDATGKLMECQFVPCESTFTYFDSTRRYIEAHGKPVAFYSDKHSTFRSTNKNGTSGDGITQFGRAMSDLNIDIICANSPQAKGRVERANRTLQDRLVKEMRLRNISTVDEGNKYLSEFITGFNTKFSKEPLNTKDMHRPLMDHEKDLNEIFCVQESRTLTKNLTVQYDKRVYIIKDSIETRVLARKKVTVYDYYDGGINIKYENKILPYSIFDKIKKSKQGRVIENKRLEAALNFIIDEQQMIDEKRRASCPSRQHLGLEGTKAIRKSTYKNRRK